MTTLIVGCGYLGQRLGRLLYERGERVFGTVRSTTRAAVIGALGIEPVIADVLAPDSLRQLPKTERVFYCVGFDRTAGSSMRAVYVDGLQNVLDRLSRSVTRFVYASSTGVYGQTDGRWVDETSPTCPQHESGKVCLEAEDRVFSWAKTVDHGASTVALRFAGLYGPGRFVRQSVLERGEPIPGDPQKFLNLIHTDDAAQAAAAALTADQPDPVYLVCDDRPVTRAEYYSRMATLLGTPEPRFVAPGPETVETTRDATNKRVSNCRMKSGLHVVLIYPDLTTGLPASLETSQSIGAGST